MSSRYVLKTPLFGCDVCIKEVPVSVGDNAEADEYVSYFFGLECYQRWHERQQDRETEISPLNTSCA